MVASVPADMETYSTDQALRARTGNAWRQQLFAGGEDRTRASVYRTGEALYSTASVIPVLTEDFDPDGMFNYTKGFEGASLGYTGLIVPHSGDYLCVGSISSNSHGLTSGIVQIWFGVNGSSTAFECGQKVTSGAGVYVNTCGILRLGAGSLVELQGVSSGGFLPLTTSYLQVLCVGW